MFTNPGQVYELANRLIVASRAHGGTDTAQRLDDVLNAGSSVLEILGAIQAVLREEGGTLEQYVDRAEIDTAIRYVDHAFGRS